MLFLLINYWILSLFNYHPSFLWHSDCVYTWATRQMLPVWSVRSFGCRLWRKAKEKSRRIWWERWWCCCGKKTLPGLSVESIGLQDRYIINHSIKLLMMSTSLTVFEHLDPPGVFGAWDEDSPSSIWNRFRAYCWWFYLHVFLCGQWFLASHANIGDSWGV